MVTYLQFTYVSRHLGIHKLKFFQKINFLGNKILHFNHFHGRNKTHQGSVGPQRVTHARCCIV